MISSKRFLPVALALCLAAVQVCRGQAVLNYSPVQPPAAPVIAISGSTALITASDAGAEIHFTTDGTTPTAASALYTGAIPLTGGSTVTVKAIAYLAPVSSAGSITATIPDADVSAYTSNVATAGGTMTSARQSAVSTFVTSTKSHGTWAHLLDVWAPATDAFAGALVKVKAYTGTGASMGNTGFVTGDYAPATGLLGASGKFLNTGFNYQTYGSSVAGYSYYAMDDSAPGGTLLGYFTGTGGGISGDFRLMFQTAASSTVYNGRNFGQQFGPTATAGNSRVFLHIERNSLTSGSFYVDGVNVGTDTGTMTSAPQNITAKAFAIHNANATTPDNFYTGHAGFFAIDDGGMTATQAASFYADVKALMDALGRIQRASTPARITLVTGQSLATGANSATTLSTTQPYGNRALNSSGGGTGYAHYPLNLTPLVEGTQVAGAYESPGSGFANQQAALWRADHAGDASKDLVVGNYAVGSTTIATRSKAYGGGVATNIYNTSISGLQEMMNVAPDYFTGGAAVPGMLQVDGQSDYNSTTYTSDLTALQASYETDIKAKTGQSTGVPMFYFQDSGWTSTGESSGNASTATIGPAQLAAFEANPAKLILCCPQYIFTHGTGTNDVHLTSPGYRWMGEYGGHAWDAVVNRGGTWGPMRPLGITRSGATITVQCASGTSNASVTGGAVIDTTTVTSPNGAADGLEYYQTGGTAQTISSVAVSGSTITITLSGDPGSPTAERLRYAFTGTAGNAGGPTTGPRGCIRDADATMGLDGNHLYNWMVTFDYAMGTTGLN